jgi:hypothetical protein
MTEENEVGKPMQLRRLLPLKHQLSSLESEVTEVGGLISFEISSDFLLLHMESPTLQARIAQQHIHCPDQGDVVPSNSLAKRLKACWSTTSPWRG